MDTEWKPKNFFVSAKDEEELQKELKRNRILTKVICLEIAKKTNLNEAEIRSWMRSRRDKHARDVIISKIQIQFIQVINALLAPFQLEQKREIKPITEDIEKILETEFLLFRQLRKNILQRLSNETGLGFSQIRDWMKTRRKQKRLVCSLYPAFNENYEFLI